MKLSKYIGSKAFYRRVIAITAPVLLQNVITNFVSLLDNIMVGQVGTEPMSGVAIVNQIIFVYNLCLFGGLAGPGIFTAQYYGKGDMKGVRDTMRAKFYMVAAALVVFSTVFLTCGEQLIGLFLHEGQDKLDLAATLQYGKDYLAVMMWQLLPFGVMQVYSGTLRETGETVIPMKAGIAAVFVNLVGNWILIFGNLGAPEMGVVGAAIATVISRFVECGIVVIWTHRHTEERPFAKGLFRSFRVPGELAKQMVVLGAPLLINEVLWSSGMAVLNQCYSIRGLEVVSATNISSTVSNLFFCAFFAMGSAVSIIVGQLLGAGELERAVDEDRKIIALAVVLCAAVGAVMAVFAPLIPEIYNTTDMVKKLASQLLIVSAVMMPVNGFVHTCYFTLRTGGKTIITFLFDSAFLWALCIPAAFIMSRFTELAILPMYIIVHSFDFVKSAIGCILLRKRKWVNNLVADK